MPRRKQTPSKTTSLEDSVEEVEVKKAKVENGNGVDENTSATKVNLPLPETFGELLICGGTNWSLRGQKKCKKEEVKYENVGKKLFKPTRMTAMKGVKVSDVFTGPTSCHSLLIDDKGLLYSWGRNESGELGHGDTQRLDVPKVVESLRNKVVVKAACGRQHTLVLTQQGQVYAFGENLQGQLGLGNISTAVPTPTKIKYSGNPIVDISCGAEFSMIVDCEGYCYSFGSSEYGQLGNNTDGKYFATSTKLLYDQVKTPFRIPMYIEKSQGGNKVAVTDVKITQVACGINHTVAVDSNKRVYTWGFGGYGRLGHAEQKDEWRPRLVSQFDRKGRGAMKVWAGSTHTMALNELGCTFYWGVQGSVGTRECTMYPKPFSDLQGWNVRLVGCGNKHVVVAADDAVIVWGVQTQSGEIGLGEQRKSSSKPDFMKACDNLNIRGISCGLCHTIMIARNDGDDDDKLLGNLGEYDPVACP